MGGAIDYPESPLGVPCGGEVKLNKLAVSNSRSRICAANAFHFVSSSVISGTGINLESGRMYARPLSMTLALQTPSVLSRVGFSYPSDGPRCSRILGVNYHHHLT